MAVHIGQTSVHPAAPRGQAFMSDAQQVRDRSVKVANLGGIIAVKRFMTHPSDGSWVMPPRIPPPASQLVKTHGL